MSLTPDELGQKIKTALEKRDQKAPGSTAAREDTYGTGQALRAGVDLVAALVVGGFLGYWLDRWLGTRPWGMIIFFFAGFAAGFLNIYRSQQGQDYKIGFKETTKDKE